MPLIVNPERKARAASDFRFFCESYFPLTFHLPWSPDHIKVIGRIEQAVLRGGLFAMAMPRGSGKTTVCECACIWAALLLRGTGAFGEIAEGGSGPGLLPALRRWMREHPEWSVIYHTRDQYGLTLISRDVRDKPALPSKITMAANLAKAMAAHVVDGMHMATAEELEARLSVCTLCDHRRDDRCSVCGCFLAPKAALHSSECPIGRWPAAIDPAPAKEAA